MTTVRFQGDLNQLFRGAGFSAYAAKSKILHLIVFPTYLPINTTFRLIRAVLTSS